MCEPQGFGELKSPPLCMNSDAWHRGCTRAFGVRGVGPNSQISPES
jgi:hypothetical protein